MAYPINTKVSKPAVTAGPAGTSIPTSGLTSGLKKPGGGWFRGFITLIIILVIIGGGLYLVASYTGVGGGILLKGGNFEGNWQAVFLTNGQVYFGKVDRVNSEFVFLKNIYYLQVVNLEDTIAQPPDVQNQPEQRLTLIKLGNEIHGPTDHMLINREHVVIIEDLKNDSRVVQAIDDYLKNQNNPQN